MDMQKQYKESYDDIVLGEEKIEQIKDFEQLKEWREKKSLQRRTQRIRKVLVAAAVVAVVFLAGNTIAYAKTGESLVQHTEKAVRIVIKREAKTPGVYEATIKESDADINVMIVDDDKVQKVHDAGESPAGTKKIYIHDAHDAEIEMHFIPDVELEQRGDKIYLVVTDDVKEEIDITEDFADGKATGKFSVEGKKFRYKVTGDIDKYNIDTEQI